MMSQYFRDFNVPRLPPTPPPPGGRVRVVPVERFRGIIFATESIVAGRGLGLISVTELLRLGLVNAT